MKEERKKRVFPLREQAFRVFARHYTRYDSNEIPWPIRRQLFEPSRKQYDKVMEELKDIANQSQTKILDNFTKKICYSLAFPGIQYLA